MINEISNYREIQEILELIYNEKNVRLHYSHAASEPYCFTVFIENVEAIDFEFMEFFSEKWGLEFKWRNAVIGSHFVLFKD